MPIRKILNEDWTDYDNRKIRDRRDSKFFACSETWEVDFLKNKIKRNHPTKTEEAILHAIKMCCALGSAPYPREKFVECVLKRLSIIA